MPKHAYECWADREGECRIGCDCLCHPVRLDGNGYVKEPEVVGEGGPSLFDYLEAAYGVDRAESLTIGIWKDLDKARSRAGKVIAAGPPATQLNPRQVYTEVNEIESLIDSIEMGLFGEKSTEFAEIEYEEGS